jgi:hypothetical protein
MLSDVSNGALGVTVNTKTLIGDGLKVLPTVTSATDYLRQISETREYLYNLFLSEFGIHANTAALKRERVLTGEIDMQIEKPVFNIESMLKARTEGAAKISEKFGKSITVRINPKFMYVEKESEGENDDMSAPDTQADDENMGYNVEPTDESDNVPN